MTLEREGRNGPFVICCNNCSDTYECEGHDFVSAMTDARSEGWFVIERKDGWKHYCSQPCAREED